MRHFSSDGLRLGAKPSRFRSKCLRDGGHGGSTTRGNATTVIHLVGLRERSQGRRAFIRSDEKGEVPRVSALDGCVARGSWHSSRLRSRCPSEAMLCLVRNTTTTMVLTPTGKREDRSMIALERAMGGAFAWAKATGEVGAENLGHWGG